MFNRPALWICLILPPALCLALLSCGATPTPEVSAPAAAAPQPGYFEDRTPGSGIDFRYRNGEEAGHCGLLESLGGGVALLDYAGDGYFGGTRNEDIHGYPCRLYRNLGNWKFEDVTARVGLDRPPFYSHGGA